jgi:hypothetical protein
MGPDLKCGLKVEQRLSVMVQIQSALAAVQMSPGVALPRYQSDNA